MHKSLIINNQTLVESGEISHLFPKIHDVLMDLSLIYPNFKGWYEGKIVPGLESGDRSLLVEIRNSELAGIAIIKDTIEEKKLCCLRVLPKFQNKSGVGLQLFERSMSELNTRYPLLSVSNDRHEYFDRIFKYYGFKKTWEYPNLYRPQKTEYSFNGLILPVNQTKRGNKYKFTGDTRSLMRELVSA